MSASLRWEPVLDAGDGCEVARLGRALAVAFKRYEDLEELEVRQGQKPNGLKGRAAEAARHAYDRTEALRASVSAHMARSLEGCMVQLAEAATLADALSVNAEEEHKVEWRALDRLLYSVLMHLEDVTGKDVARDLGLEHIAKSDQGPWARAEDRLDVRGPNAEEDRP